ncbi:unnamed protein product [Prorocentrum cordatum]|uniref:Ribosome biogenesis protein NOP53 n=1 Tax=Prorocentrum cordatum TaxID=2364126 RepID=A0ABN9V2K0_9DINO|nr:unnamed protein product [Polarella glacialis]
MGKQTTKQRKRQPGRKGATNAVKQKVQKARQKKARKAKKGEKQINDLADMLARTGPAAGEAEAGGGAGAGDAEMDSKADGGVAAVAALPRAELKKKLRAKIAGGQLENARRASRGARWIAGVNNDQREPKGSQRARRCKDGYVKGEAEAACALDLYVCYPI